MPITINGKIFPDFSSAVTFIKSARPDIEDPEGYVAAIARDQEEKEEEEEKENTGSSYNRELVGSTNKTMVIGQPTGNVNRDAFTDGTKTKPLPITTSKMKNGYGVGTEGGLRHTRTGQKVPRSLSPKRIKSRKIRLLRFVYVNTKVAKEGGKDCEICKQYDGHVYEVNSPNRPVIPRLEPTRKRKGPFTHPNCECRWARPIEAYIQEQYAEESAVGIGEAGVIGNSMRIHGTLAYAGTSHNNRIYLPETLADGDKKVLPLIFNHGTTDGLESDAIWNNLPDDIRRRITNHERIKIGSIELRWDKTRLTLFYDAVVTHEFFQSEIRAGKMSVSLGLLFEYDGKKVCDLECYTIVRRGQWNEVSLVYSPGFPIATIETHEMRLGQTALEYAAREFDEDEHPRGGDSEHPGRFSAKGSGDNGRSSNSNDSLDKHIKDYEYITKSDLPNLNNLYYKEGILSEIANDIAAENKDKLKQFQFRHTSGFSIMMGDTRITESEIPKYYQVLKKIRQIIPKKIHDMVDLENNKIKEKWKNGDSLFRGANEKELWDYLANDNIVGSGKTWKTAGNREETQFVPTSLSRDYAARHVKEGRGHVLLEFEGGQQDSAPVTYEMRGLTEVIDEDGKTYRPGEKYDNSTHPIEFMHEEEIHLRQGSTRKLKSIQFQSTDPNDIERFKNNLSKYDMSDTEIRYGISDQGKEFIEDEHPRGGDSEHPGRFSDKSGGGGGDGKGKDKGKDKSDDIWKKTNMPAKLSDEHKKNLDDAWKSIPAQYTEGIEKVLIRVGKGWSGSGSYSPIKNKVNVTAGEIKPSAILHHEVHHHMWHNKRTEAQRQKWRDGVKRIMDMDRKSPTIYSDSYTPRSEMNRIKSLVIKRKKFNDKLKAGEMNVDMCYPDYTAYKKIIRTDLKFKEKMGLPMSQDLRVIMADTKKMKDEYDKLSKDGRRSLAYKNYDEKVEGISNRTKAIKYSEIFYNEVHSEVGSYINDKEAKLTRDTMSFNIKKYVTLYREVFGTTS